MDKQTYFSTHPGYEEIEVPEYKDHPLRLITPDEVHAKESLAWVQDREVGKYMGADFSNVSLEGETERLKEIMANQDGYNWLIEYDETVIGNININEIKATSEEFGVKAGSLNYILGVRELWGNGIVSSATNAVLDWAFEKNDFKVIKSRVVPQNKGSIAVLQKAGFVEYGREDYDGPDFGEPTWYITYKLSNTTS